MSSWAAWKRRCGKAASCCPDCPCQALQAAVVSPCWGCDGFRMWYCLQGAWPPLLTLVTNSKVPVSNRVNYYSIVCSHQSELGYVKFPVTLQKLLLRCAMIFLKKKKQKTTHTQKKKHKQNQNQKQPPPNTNTTCFLICIFSGWTYIPSGLPWLSTLHCVSAFLKHSQVVPSKDYLVKVKISVVLLALQISFSDCRLWYFRSGQCSFPVNFS